MAYRKSRFFASQIFISQAIYAEKTLVSKLSDLD